MVVIEHWYHSKLLCLTEDIAISWWSKIKLYYNIFNNNFFLSPTATQVTDLGWSNNCKHKNALYLKKNWKKKINLKWLNQMLRGNCQNDNITDMRYLSHYWFSWLSTVLSLLDHSMLTNDELESVWPGVGKAWPLRLHCQPVTIPSPQSDWLTLERRSFGDYN